CRTAQCKAVVPSTWGTLMFVRSAMSEPTAALSPRWTASANRESAAKSGTASITDKLTVISAFSLIRAPPRQSQVPDGTGFRGIPSRLHAAVKRGGCDIFFAKSLSAKIVRAIQSPDNTGGRTNETEARGVGRSPSLALAASPRTGFFSGRTGDPFRHTWV